ncbi:MAG TPA: lytic transglycosylase domain-containing protein [Stellaceae bacterium]
MQGRRYRLLPGRTWARIGIFVALAAVLPGSLATFSGNAAAQSVRTSALTPGAERLREADLPSVLASSDAQRYRRIFGLQGTGQFAAANRDIAQLKDKLLIGAVLAQRYLHPRYRPSYAELSRWLAQHADEPNAKAIYALALKRRPAGAAEPTTPVVAALIPRGLGDEAVDASALDTGSEQKVLGRSDRRRAEELQGEIRGLAFSAPRKAELMLGGNEARRLLDEDDSDELRVLVAEGYLAAGQAQQALMLSAHAHSAGYAPAGHWYAGLAAWRLGRLGEARGHFQALARARGQSGWTIAAAAFWAARVELRSGRPELFTYWLGIAAEHPRTFYGLLARHTLGVDTNFDFDGDPFTEVDAEMLQGQPAGRRALALLQLGDTPRAEAELRTLAARGSPALIEALIGLADRANMPALSLQLAGLTAEGAGRRHHALYPVPRWTPLGGFTVDRALVFAVMRQESQFLADARSYAGAMGVMQLMPATAHAMARRAGVALSSRDKQRMRDALADPEVNMALAQEYITELMQDGHIKGNLLLLAAAYNCGPGALQRWQSDPQLRKDPLLFVESIPSHQTRVFTQRVLTNYWIYRQRLGQSAPDLDALAAGEWPTYTALDRPPEPERRHAENR